MPAAPVTLRGEETFSDSNHWADLAREFGIRLPQWRTPTTTGGMRKFLRKLGKTVNEYLHEENDDRLNRFMQRNPTWPLRAWVGMELEKLAWDKEHPESAKRLKEMK